MTQRAHTARLATPADAAAIGQMLHDFNTEYEEETPGAAYLEQRVRHLMGAAAVTVVVAGDPPVGMAAMAFHESLWSDSLECYLAELYVVPAHRGHGIGRAIMERAMDEARDRGASYMFLQTGEDDTVARRLYSSCGFSSSEPQPDGSPILCYEREL